MGPFKIEVRERILRELRVLEQNVGQRLISDSELDVISDIWCRDRVREESRTAFRNTFADGV